MHAPLVSSTPQQGHPLLEFVLYQAAGTWGPWPGVTHMKTVPGDATLDHMGHDLCQDG